MILSNIFIYNGRFCCGIESLWRKKMDIFDIGVLW